MALGSRKMGEYSIQRGRGIANGKDQGDETTGNLARAKEPLEIGVLNVRTLKLNTSKVNLRMFLERYEQTSLAQIVDVMMKNSSFLPLGNTN